MPDLLVVPAVASPLLVALAVLTGVGQRRRGHGWAGVVLAALVFPLTWIAWYVADEHASRPSRPSRT